MPARVLVAIGSLVLSVVSAPVRAQGVAAAEAAFYAVSYVEVAPGSRSEALAALERYAGGGRAAGLISFERYEQVGRRGHLVVIEAWRSQSAFDAAAAARQQLVAALQPIRLSGYDERPYKPLSVGPGAPEPARKGMAIVVAHVDTTPNAQVPDLLRHHAEDSRRDEGTVRFDVLQHTMRANHFTVIEMWRDRRALDHHAAAAHTKQYREELEPLTGSPLDERIYEVVE